MTAGKKQAKKPHGALTFTQEKADAICKRLADGESLRAICETDGMPSEATVRAWALDDVQGFATQYARARELGYERLADEILAIADTPQIGVKTVSKATGVETTEGDMVEHRRLRVDARKWMLAKMLPKRFGERLELAGSIGVKKSPADMTDEELAAIAAGKARKGDA